MVRTCNASRVNLKINTEFWPENPQKIYHFGDLGIDESNIKIDLTDIVLGCVLDLYSYIAQNRRALVCTFHKRREISLPQVAPEGLLSKMLVI
jgi:hypothetical protein